MTKAPPGSFVRRHRSGAWSVDPLRRWSGWLIDEMILAEWQRFVASEPAGQLGCLLDLGAGERPYAPVYAPHADQTVALDWPGSLHGAGGLDVWGSAESLPFAGASFDTILCTEVLEHVREPERVLAECCRVLRPGGWLFLTTPFFNPLHELPWDFYRYTPFALQALGEGAGLSLRRVSEKGGLGAFLLMLWVYLATLLGLRGSRGLGGWPFSRWNPFFWAGLIWPQQLYLRWWKSRSLGQRDHSLQPTSSDSSLLAVTLGYVAVFQKPH